MALRYLRKGGLNREVKVWNPYWKRKSYKKGPQKGKKFNRLSQIMHKNLPFPCEPQKKFIMAFKTLVSLYYTNPRFYPTLIYLPPCSPDLNSIEKKWSNKSHQKTRWWKSRAAIYKAINIIKLLLLGCISKVAKLLHNRHNKSKRTALILFTND